MKTIKIEQTIVKKLDKFAKPHKEKTLMQLAQAKSVPNYKRATTKAFSEQLGDTFESRANYVRSEVREFPSRYGLK